VADPRWRERRGGHALEEVIIQRLPTADASEAYPIAVGERGSSLAVMLEWPED